MDFSAILGCDTFQKRYAFTRDGSAIWCM